MKYPLDRTCYPPDPRSTLLRPGLADGGYVYVQDLSGYIYVLPDGPHLHPKVIGGGQAVLYAGDLVVQGGDIVDLTNLSGTFQCDDEDGLLRVAAAVRTLGILLAHGAVRFFPLDGSRPVILE